MAETFGVTGWLLEPKISRRGKLMSVAEEEFVKFMAEDVTHRYREVMPRDDVEQIVLRLPVKTLDAVDKRAKKVGISRNAWINLAIEHVLDIPLQEKTVKRTEKKVY